MNNDGLKADLVATSYLVSEAKPTASTARIYDYRREQLAN